MYDKDLKNIGSWKEEKERKKNLERILKLGIIIGSAIAVFSGGKYLYELNQSYNRFSKCPKINYKVERFIPIKELSKQFGYKGIEADTFERVVEDLNSLFQPDGTTFPLRPGREYKIPNCKMRID